MHASEPITMALQDLARGDKSGLDRLMPYVYPELRKPASNYLRREGAGHRLQPTALVHEAYFRLVDQTLPDCKGRAHFLGVAGILIDHSRRGPQSEGPVSRFSPLTVYDPRAAGGDGYGGGRDPGTRNPRCSKSQVDRDAFLGRIDRRGI